MRADADERSAFGVLLRLFVRRMIDNDVISPHADRHESLAVAYGLMATLGVFATFFVSTGYLSAFIQLPGPAALSALSDRFLFLAASLTTSALSALIAWDSLAFEPRDADILGPLPIPSRTLTRAKLAAVMAFGTLLTVALNVAPSVLYPAFLTVNIRGIRAATIVQLIAAHAATVTAAGLFGFFGVVGIRGMLVLSLGERTFRRVSSAVQSVFVIGAVTSLLLAPSVAAGTVRRWVARSTERPIAARPVLWYLGANEVLAGKQVADTPVVPPPRLPLNVIRPRGNSEARAVYHTLLPQFAALARTASLSFVLVVATAMATFFRVNRRLPERTTAIATRSRLAAYVYQTVERLTRDDPEAQAGFFFTLQTLTRSAPHRTILAIALAIGLTHALLVVAAGGSAPAIATTPLGALATAILLVITLVAGVGYAARVPAEHAANWTFRMAWDGDERRYLVGVKRAALLLVGALLLVLLPWHVARLGTFIAAAHSLLSVLFAIAILDILFLRGRQLPFACGYVPIDNPKAAWPAAFVGAFLVTYSFAAVERWALQADGRAIALAAALGGVAIVIRAFDRSRRRERGLVNFEGRPSLATQRLGLDAHLAAYD